MKMDMEMQVEVKMTAKMVTLMRHVERWKLE